MSEIHKPEAESQLVPIEPSKRLEGVKWISYRTLLATGRAIKRRRNYLFVSSAGDNPQIQRLTCTSKTEAQRLGAAIATDLRQARSDGQYNKILLKILETIRSTWVTQPALEHVHTCGLGKQCDVDPTGKTTCGFDWPEHQLTIDCTCGPELDQSDTSGKYHFVVHKDLKGRTKVFV